MLTDTMQAWQIEPGDWILLGSDTAWEVLVRNDDDSLVLRDEDGETHEDNPVSFDPDETITYVTRWDDPDEDNEETEQSND